MIICFANSMRADGLEAAAERSSRTAAENDQEYALTSALLASASTDSADRRESPESEEASVESIFREIRIRKREKQERTDG